MKVVGAKLGNDIGWDICRFTPFLQVKRVRGVAYTTKVSPQATDDCVSYEFVGFFEGPKPATLDIFEGFFLRISLKRKNVITWVDFQWQKRGTFLIFCRFSSSAPSVRCPDGGFSTCSAEWFSTRCLGLYGSLQGGLFGWTNSTYVLWWCEDDVYEDVDVDEKRGWFWWIVLVLFMCSCGLEFFYWVWKWGVSPALEASLLLTGRSVWQFPGLRWAWCWWRWRVDWCCIVNLYILRLGGWVGNMWCFDVQLDDWESTYFFLVLNTWVQLLSCGRWVFQESLWWPKPLPEASSPVPLQCDLCCGKQRRDPNVTK